MPLHPLGRFVRASVALALLVAAPGAFAADAVRIGGTGMALGLMQRVGDALAAQGIRAEVLPSLGTPGGLRALEDGAIDIAVTGRRLKPQERATGAEEAMCLVTPLVFASSHPDPAGIQLVALPALYHDPAPKWPDGSPLRIVLRSRAGSENAYLAAAVPGLGPAIDAAYGRSGMAIAMTDQENAVVARDMAGSFAVMTLLQIRSERLDLRPIAVDGVAPSAEVVADDRYPLRADVCVVLPKQPSAAAQALVAHLRSEAGASLLHSLGAAPAK